MMSHALGFIILAVLHIVLAKYNSPCTASNLMKTKVAIIFSMIKKLISTFGCIQFDAVNGELCSGIHNFSCVANSSGKVQLTMYCIKLDETKGGNHLFYHRKDDFHLWFHPI
jgi:hypothetical protein